MPLIPGTKLGTYEILSLLGSGGMGEVCRAKDLKLGRDVAIKVLRQEFASDPERLRRFEREARAASSLNHPNIVTIYDIGKDGPTSYIAMEYVQGQTLREMLDGGPLPIKKLLQVASQMADGLTKAHSAGIVHRDLKPKNLMVTSDGFVKILDFGLAKLIPGPSGGDSELTTLTRGTGEGVILGTVQYMSPEQAAGRAVDYRSDQFSFGLILYEMATGVRAFQRETGAEILAAIIRDEPKPVANLKPESPAPLRWIIERCLAKEPAERYVSTSDLAKELRGLRDHVSEVPSESATVSPPQAGKRTAWTRVAGIAGILLAGLALALGLNVGHLRDRLLGEATPGPIKSIAVLPLENLSGDPEQEYFADGMTEALITNLAKIGALKVISRTSTMRFKGTDKSIPDIARILKVDAVVEGSVLRADGRVRITAQLIHGATDQHLWAKSYDRDLENVLVVLSEVAQAIAGEIKVALTPEQQERLASARAVSPEIQEAYLKATFYLNRGVNPDDQQKAIALYRQTIDLDRTFGPAYAGLAGAEWLLGFIRAAPLDAATARAEAAALRALELDPELSGPHTVLGWIRFFYYWDWTGAESEFRRALALNPNDPNAHTGLADYMLVRGDLEEAVRQLELGRQCDPLSPLTIEVVVSHLVLARRYDEAIAEADRLLELFPEDRQVRRMRARALWHRGSYEEALAEYRKGGESDSEAMEQAYRERGPRAAMRTCADFLAAQSRKTGQASPVTVAVYYAAAEEKDLAFEWLEKAFNARTPQLMHLKADPSFDPLRSDPRFHDLLRRMKFPE